MSARANLPAALTVLAAAILAAGFAPQTAAAQENSEAVPYAEAQRHFHGGDPAAALDVLRKARQGDPESPPAEVTLARWSAAVGDIASERYWLDRAVVAAPEDAEALLVLADAALLAGQITEAAVLCEQAEALAAGEGSRARNLRARAHGGLAAVARQRGDHAAMAQHLEALLAIRPEDAPALRLRASMHFREGQIDEAVERLEAAAAADPDVPVGEALLAQLYQERGDRANAGKQMTAALTAHPRHLPTRLAAAEWSLATGQFDQARRQAELALQLDPESRPARRLRGLAAFAVQDFPAAESDLAAVLAESPADFTAAQYLAKALAEQDDDAKRRRAVEYGEVLFRQYPQSGEAAAAHGWALYRSGRIDDAERVLSAAAEGAAPTRDGAFLMARIHLDRGRRAEARTFLEFSLTAPGPFWREPQARALRLELAQ